MQGQEILKNVIPCFGSLDPRTIEIEEYRRRSRHFGGGPRQTDVASGGGCSHGGEQEGEQKQGEGLEHGGGLSAPSPLSDSIGIFPHIPASTVIMSPLQ